VFCALLAGCKAVVNQPSPVELPDKEIAGSYGGNPLRFIRRVPLLGPPGTVLKVCIESVSFGDDLATLLSAVDPVGGFGGAAPLVGAPEESELTPGGDPFSVVIHIVAQLFNWPTNEADVLPESRFFFNQEVLPAYALMVLAPTCGKPYSIQITVNSVTTSLDLPNRIALGFNRDRNSIGFRAEDSHIDFDLAELGARILEASDKTELHNAVHNNYGVFRPGGR
jgi:hypothetical protein